MAGSGTSMKTAQIRVFSGLNRRSGAGDGELTFTRNLTTDEYPALSTRAPMRSYGGVKSTVTGEDGGETEALTPFENASDVFECDGSIFVAQDGALFRDGVKIADVFSGKKQWGLVGGKLVIWPDRKYVNLHSGDVRSIEENAECQIAVKNGVLNSAGIGKTIGTATWTRYSYSYRENGSIMATVSAWGEYLAIFQNLSYANGQWSYTGQGSWAGGNIDAEDNYYFCGSSPPIKYYNEYDTIPSVPTPSGNGTISKIRKLTTTYVTTDYEEVGAFSIKTTYTHVMEYESYGSGTKLSDLFESGDTVKIEGCALLCNNREFVLKEISGNNAKVDGFVESAGYMTLTSDLSEGIYQVSGTWYQVTRRLLAGEQLYTLNDGVLRVYNPQTQTEESFQSVSSGTVTATLTMNSYDSTNRVTLTIKRECPDMEFICAHNNRLFGVSNREEGKVWNSLTGKVETVKSRVLHASELGFPTRWNSYNGNAMDSYSVAIGGSGDFTGICEYGGAVLLFKEDKLYRLTGDYPADYYLRDYSLDGVKQGCHRSLCCINEVLYYLSPRGVMAYSGGAPSMISYKLGMGSPEEACGGRDRSTYYLAVRETDGSSALFRYDTIHGLWMQQDETRVDAVCRLGDRALLLSGGALRITEEQSGEAVTWEAVLAETDEGTFCTKIYDQILLDAELGENAWLQLWIRMDGAQEWTLLNTVTTQDTARWQRLEHLSGKQRGRWQFKIPANRCSRMTLRVNGCGHAVIHSVGRVFQLASERT